MLLHFFELPRQPASPQRQRVTLNNSAAASLQCCNFSSLNSNQQRDALAKGDPWRPSVSMGLVLSALKAGEKLPLPAPGELRPSGRSSSASRSNSAAVMKSSWSSSLDCSAESTSPRLGCL